MSSSRPASGLTTSIVTVGLSIVASVTMAPNVVWSQFRQLTGTSLVFGTYSVNGPTAAPAYASLMASGGVLSTSLIGWTYIDGPAGMAFASGGATATVSMIRGLGEGYDGQY